MKKDLTRGWTTWLAMWEDLVRRKRMLQHAASSLKNPELSHAFRLIKNDWLEIKEAEREKAQRLKDAQMELGVVGLQAELERVTKEYERKLTVAERTQSTLLDKLTKLDGGAAAAEMELEAQAAQAELENEKRIEHLCSMIARRMLRKDLARGWNEWVEKWEEANRMKRMLAHAAAKLKNPELAEAFHIWQDEYYEGKQAQLEKAKLAEQRKREKALEAGATNAKDEAERVQKECEKKLQAWEIKYNSLMDRLTELDGGAAEKELRLQEQLEKEAKEKEKRIEHLSGMIARRMLKKDLARGWTMWLEMWEEEQRRKRLLQRASNKMRSPGLSTSFYHWKDDWDATQRAAAEEAAKARELALTKSRADLAEELVRIKQQYEQRLKDAEQDKLTALEQQLMEVLGTADGEKMAQEQKAKEERVELLCRQMVRRMLYSDITTAFNSWIDMWETKTHINRCMRKSVGRLSKPAMAGAFAFWVNTWTQEKLALERKRAEERRAALEEELRKTKLDVGKAGLIQVAHEDELRALRAKVITLNDDLTGKKHALMSAEEERKQFEKLQLLHKSTVNMLEAVTKERDEHIKHSRDELAKQKGLLQELLAEQRSTFEDEIARSKKQVTESNKELKQMREQLAAMEKEVIRLTPKKRAPPKNTISLSGDPNKSLSDQLAEALKANATRVMDLFRSWDSDGDGEVSRAEFHKAMPALGLDIPKKAVDELFNQWDDDGGGALAYKELKRILSGTTQPKKKVALSGEGPLSNQLAEALKANASRVMDLFRSWDRDGDGEVSRTEFQRAIPALGFDVPKADVDELFNMWDNDGGGSVNYKELKKILGSVPSPARPSLGGAAKAVKAATTVSKLSSAASILGKMKPGAPSEAGTPSSGGDGKTSS